jgi:O-antigen ligase
MPSPGRAASADLNSATGAHSALVAILLTGLLGALFAVVVSRLWNLEARWFVVACAGIVLISTTMLAVRWLADYLLVLLLLSFPLAGLSKWLFVDWLGDDQKGNILYGGAIGIGPLDLCLAALGVTWAWQVLVQRLPHPALPWLPSASLALLVVSYLASLPGAPEPSLGGFALAYLAKHLFLFLYIASHIDGRRLKWVVAALMAAILLESALSLLQSQLGILEGLARDKGAGDSSRQAQYEVPGIESHTRAEGTAYDSHALALFFCMAMPTVGLMVFNRQWSDRYRLACAGTWLVGLVGLVTTFSRSGWLSFAISHAILLLGVALLRWRLIRLLPWLLLTLLLLTPLLPWVYGYLYERFSSAPEEIMNARFEQWSVAFEIWRHHPWFGFGVGNYMEAVRFYNYNGALELPVHNVLLWVAAETGLLGVIAFFGFFGRLLLRLWRLADDPRDPVALVAAGLFTAVCAYLLDGLTDPLFREPLVYATIWLLAGIGVALGRIRNEAAAFGAKAKENA